MVQKESKPS